ncbi:chemerin-like receptor 1 [Acanthochromis polyacanthus]|uniref:chemerin-like receptor 1 n=1 Tax=Acanthochromis polyacanthus TaxID=80966 RepID=UPI0022346C7E|nr:chemerin-like receptor 1 [Acanthochromis polyacanthus]
MMETINSSSYNFITTTQPPGDGYDDFDKYADLFKSLHIMSMIVYSLVFVLGVVGNGVVIWVTGFKMKKTVNTVWILNLAVADFLFTAFLPLKVTHLALDFHWPFGNFMCKLHTTVSLLNMFTSIYLLMVISVDRCVSVVWPVWAQNHRNIRKASWVSLGVWVVASILSVPYFVFRDTEVDPEDRFTFCFDNFALSDDYETPSVNQLRQSRNEALVVVQFFLKFLIPFTVIVSCYAIIIHRLRRNRTLASQTSRPFKIIVAIIITFFVCWAPLHIMGLIHLVKFSSDEPNNKLEFVISVSIPIATNLAFLNSCLNPLLYVFMGQDFKDEVRKSILKALESAFQEEKTRSTYATKTGESKERSAADDTEV